MPRGTYEPMPEPRRRQLREEVGRASNKPAHFPIMDAINQLVGLHFRRHDGDEMSKISEPRRTKGRHHCPAVAQPCRADVARMALGGTPQGSPYCIALPALSGQSHA